MPVNLKKKCFETVKRYAVFLFGSYEKYNLLSDSRKSHLSRVIKRKISRLIFKLFPGKGFALSKYSPVTLHYKFLLLLQFLMKPLGCTIHIFGAFCRH